MGELNGKVALLTGAGSLIGAAIGQRLVDEGARVVMGGRDTALGAEVSEPLGDAARFIRTDITIDADLDAMVNLAVDDFGGVDLVISGAAVFDCAMLETTRDQWRRSFDINVIGAAMLIQKAVPHMRHRGGGSVVIVGSISGKASQPNRIVYPTTKTALLGLTRNMSQALAPDNIRVNHMSTTCHSVGRGAAISRSDTAAVVGPTPSLANFSPWAGWRTRRKPPTRLSISAPIGRHSSPEPTSLSTVATQPLDPKLSAKPPSKSRSSRPNQPASDNKAELMSQV